VLGAAHAYSSARGSVVAVVVFGSQRDKGGGKRDASALPTSLLAL
jgi:hypothetical protein